jgi:hypothetical protein
MFYFWHEGRKRTSLNEARAVFSCLASAEHGHKGTEIGWMLDIGQSEINLLVRKGEESPRKR